MFKQLNMQRTAKMAKKQKATGRSTCKQPTMKLVRASQNTISSVAKLRLDIASMAALADDYSSARYARNLAATEGLTRPLMRLLNRGGALERIMPNCPAIESFDHAPISRRAIEYKLVMEGLDEMAETESTTTQDWLGELKTTFENMMSSLQTQTEELKSILQSQLDALAEAEVDSDVLSGITAETVQATARLKSLDIILSSLTKLDAPSYSAKDDIEPVRAILGELTEEIKDVTGASINDDMIITVTPEVIAEDYRCAEADLNSLGYNAEQMKEILQKALDVVGALESFIEKKDTIVNTFEGASDDVVTPDAPDTTGTEGGEEGGSQASQEDLNPTVTMPGDGGEGAHIEPDGDETNIPPQGDAPTAPEFVPEAEPAVEDGDALEAEPSKVDGHRLIISGWVTLVVALVEASTTILHNVAEVGEAVAAQVAPDSAQSDDDDDDTTEGGEDTGTEEPTEEPQGDTGSEEEPEDGDDPIDEM